MDDPQDIANAYAADAKKAFSDAQVVITNAISQINNNPGPPIGFDAGDALSTLTKLAKIAINAGIAFGQTTLEVKPKPGVLILADHLATLATQSVHDAAQVADEASPLIAAKAFDRNDAVHTAVKLANIALLNSADAIQTIAAGPAQYAATESTEKYVIQPDPANSRIVTLSPVTLKGPGPVVVLPTYRLTLDPADGVLPAGATLVTLTVNSAGLASGTYVGTITVGRANAPVDVTIPVILGL